MDQTSKPSEWTKVRRKIEKENKDRFSVFVQWTMTVNPIYLCAQEYEQHGNGYNRWRLKLLLALPMDKMQFMVLFLFLFTTPPLIGFVVIFIGTHFIIIIIIITLILLFKLVFSVLAAILHRNQCYFHLSDNLYSFITIMITRWSYTTQLVLVKNIYENSNETFSWFRIKICTKFR